MAVLYFKQYSISSLHTYFLYGEYFYALSSFDMPIISRFSLPGASETGINMPSLCEEVPMSSKQEQTLQLSAPESKELRMSALCAAVFTESAPQRAHEANAQPPLRFQRSYWGPSAS